MMYVYVVTFQGGAWEDSWEEVAGVFTDEQVAWDWGLFRAYDINSRHPHQSDVEHIDTVFVRRHTLDQPNAEITCISEHLS